MVKVRRRWRNREAPYGLQLTAMVDMFTILLVFLLKSYTTSSVALSQVDNLDIPISSAVIEPREAVKMVISREAIFLEDEKLVNLNQGMLASSDIENKKVITELFDRLKKEEQKSKSIAEQNSAYKFRGEIIVQADKTIPYKTLKSVMYTSMLSGFPNVKFGLVGME
ncbi:MAG: ExbD/TolR family protein [Bdellovibrionales bacterium]